MSIIALWCIETKLLYWFYVEHTSHPHPIRSTFCRIVKLLLYETVTKTALLYQKSHVELFIYRSKVVHLESDKAPVENIIDLNYDSHFNSLFHANI